VIHACRSLVSYPCGGFNNEAIHNCNGHHKSELTNSFSWLHHSLLNSPKHTTCSTCVTRLFEPVQQSIWHQSKTPPLGCRLLSAAKQKRKATIGSLLERLDAAALHNLRHLLIYTFRFTIKGLLSHAQWNISVTSRAIDEHSID